jgi:spore maturation protein CgeB
LSPLTGNGESRILLIYNPHGVIDRDIYLSARNGSFQLEACKMEIAQTSEGHTIEKLDLLAVAEKISRFKPDFVLTINGAGLDNDGILSYLCAYMRLPLVLWYVDEPFIVPEWGRKFIPQTTVAFTFDRYYEGRLKEWGINWVFTLPLGTNAERMLGYSHMEKNKAELSNTVSFVGTLDYEKIKYLLKNISQLWTSMPPEMANVLDSAIGLYRLNPKRNIEEIIVDCSYKHGLTFEFPDGIVKQMVLSFIDREASFRLRHEIVEILKPFGISVYGEQFWRKAVGGAFYKGRINYYSPEIANLYRSSKININISKYQLKTTVNQRVFDCPLCDGFLITDYKDDIEEYFEIDKSIVVFKNPEDLKGKVAFYLDNRRRARKVIEKGKDNILSRHTYSHRLDEMARTVRRVEGESFRAACEKTLERSSPPGFQDFIEQVIEAFGSDALAVY